MKLHRDPVYLCLVGPAAGGKTTICNRLLETHAHALKVSISVTSRAPRAGEREGLSYYFVSQSEFEARIKAGEFFEYEKVHDHYYGTLTKTLDQAVSESFDLLFDIDIKGALNFKRKKPNNTVIVFLVPPSTTELVKRIRKRGSISDEELKTRLATAKSEYSQFINSWESVGLIDYFIVNDLFEESLAVVNSIYMAECARVRRMRLEELKGICSID